MSIVRTTSQQPHHRKHHLQELCRKTLVVDRGVSLGLKVRESNSGTGLVIVNVHPSSPLLRYVVIMDRLVTINGKRVNKQEDLLTNKVQRVCGIVMTLENPSIHQFQKPSYFHSFYAASGKLHMTASSDPTPVRAPFKNRVEVLKIQACSCLYGMVGVSDLILMVGDREVKTVDDLKNRPKTPHVIHIARAPSNRHLATNNTIVPRQTRYEIVSYKIISPCLVQKMGLNEDLTITSGLFGCGHSDRLAELHGEYVAEFTKEQVLNFAEQLISSTGQVKVGFHKEHEPRSPGMQFS